MRDVVVYAAGRLGMVFRRHSIDPAMTSMSVVGIVGNVSRIIPVRGAVIIPQMGRRMVNVWVIWFARADEWRREEYWWWIVARK